MPRTASGETKTDRFIETRKERTYVYERTRRYDPAKKYNVNLGTRLLGILKPGETDYHDDANILATRPKRKKAPSESTAQKRRTGMIDIVSFISKASGIEEELETALPGEAGIAQKLLTCAWFLFASDGDSMPNIRNWCRRHEGLLPCRQGINCKDTYHDLFEELGRREDVKQAVFKERRKRLGDDPVLALDSSTFEVESKNLTAGRDAVHKDKLVKQVYKVVNFYSLDSRRPVAYSLIPGNIPDHESVANALKQLEAMELKDVEIISDNGYCTENSIALMLLEGQHFITRIEADIKWIRPLVSRHRRTLEHGGGIIDCDPLFSGVKSTLTRTFTANDGRTVEKKINVFIYFSSVNKSKDDVYFRETFGKYRHTLVNGIAQSDDRKAIEAFAEKYMVIEKDGEGNIASIRTNTRNYDDHMKYNGYLVLVADKETDIDKALEKYRRREYIEEDIKNYKGHTGGRKGRVWDADTLDGQILAQFLALTMHETFEAKVKYMKDTLAKPTGDAGHDNAATFKLERQLYNWLFKNSLHEILHWFDAIVTTQAGDGKETVTWITETTKRDRLFLEKLGMAPREGAEDKYESEGSIENL